MKHILYILGLCVPSLVVAQQQNYVKKTVYKQAITSIVTNPNSEQADISITYVDGLGRPIQNVQQAASANGKNIVQHIQYDAYGRQVYDFLPYESSATTAQFETDALNSTLTFYSSTHQPNTNFPYSEKRFERSPLSRVLEQSAPGESWEIYSGHTIKLSNEFNGNNEVIKFTSSTNQSGATSVITLTNGGYYTSNTLYKTVTKDENWTSSSGNAHTTQEFKDKEGRIILKRTFGKSNNSTSVIPHDTYYIYDIYGNLSCVLPPGFNTANLTTAQLNSLAYQYVYDSRNRLIEKKLPGKTWEYIVYDKQDRVVATGPTPSPFTNTTQQGWLINKYDKFGRIVLTGWYPYSSTFNATYRNSIQSTVNSNTNNGESFNPQTANHGLTGDAPYYYTKVCWPTTGFRLLTVNYYDTYENPLNPFNSQTPTNVLNQGVDNQVNGLTISTWARILRGTGDIQGKSTFTLFDNKKRALKTVISFPQENNLEGNTSIENEYSFDGKVLKTVTSHQRTTNDTPIVTTELFTYDNSNRLLTHSHQIGNGAIKYLQINQYDALGKLIQKAIDGYPASGGNTIYEPPLQEINYKYNIRGWLTDINDVDNFTATNDAFAFRIRYDNPTPNGSQALYNGNISETQWIHKGQYTKKYHYSYDELNRLTQAVYRGNEPSLNSFGESIAYDKMGNITSLQRNGGSELMNPVVQIDNLTYSYDPSNLNRLVKVDDNTNSDLGFKNGTNTGNDYTYDTYGNMITDQNKNITAITYNHLHLPKKITFTNNQSIEYTYSATGEKFEKKVTDGTSTLTRYLDGFQYTETNLDFFPHAEGYVLREMGYDKLGRPVYSNIYIFTIKDHLGNVRTKVKKGTLLQIGETIVLETNDYYPFGLEHQALPVSSDKNKYQYNNKEFQDELGLNWNDMEARNYMPDIGRWGNMDELTEIFDSVSPYNFSNNNPIIFSDPTGLAPEYFASTVVNKKGQIIDHKDDKDDNIYLDRRGGEVVGKEREGVKYEVGKFVNQSDLTNGNVLFGNGITNISHISSHVNEPIEMYFWGAEFMETGIIKLFTYSKYLYYLSKYKKLAKSSKFMKQLIVQLEKDGARSILKSYKKISRRLNEHKAKLDAGLKYSSSVEREIRTYSQQLKELEIFMIKNKIKF